MRTSLDPFFFIVSGPFDLPTFFKGTKDSFSFLEEPVKKETLYCYDTFDWKAWNKNNTIVLYRRRLRVVDLNNGRETCSASLRKTPQSFFPDTLNDRTTTSKLLGLSKLRAFICIASVETGARRWRVLDENRKTVASVELRSMLHSPEEQITQFVTLSPVRGYVKEAEKIAGQLKKSTAHPRQTTYRDMYKRMLAVAKVTPDNYSPKPSVKLNADDSIQYSARILLLSTLEVIRANERWISKNIDTEFLHDYRVAIRRTRSILAQLKGIFPPEDLSRYKLAFREFGKRTNTLRDQDVYLLQAERFRDLLPVTMRDSLDPFFTNLRNSHKKELRAFSRYLGSEKYKLKMQEWESFLQGDLSSDHDLTPDARRQTSDIAVSTIKKAWKRVIRHGRDISRIATDTELHSLRLDCKKLRYLLEFYTSIFPAKMLVTVVRQLKTLQDNLGTFVDLSVQQNYLNDYLSNLECTPENVSFAASLGGLVTALYHEREKVRMNFHEAFHTFDRPETEALFNELFNKYR